MKITSLKIERFGVWEDLNLPKISRGLNVFFGPNEAGKTTLMQFIRTCLYGGGDEDRARYIQMALDGRRRRSRASEYDAVVNDPRRLNPNAAALDERSNVPEEIRRFIESTKKAESVPADAKEAARLVGRAWIGGAATVSSDFGDHRLERRYVRRDSNYQSAVERKAGFVVSDGLLNWSGRFYSLPGQKIAESLVVTGPDGTRVGDYLAKSLTCNLDESTYNGVFAIGLDELQKLGMLNETEAAQMLYRLSVGVDRGAFVQVFQQIVAERNDLLDSKGRPSILENLLNERDEARRSAGESASNLREYARLVEERRAVLEAVAALQDRLDKAIRQKQVRELALRVAPTWDEREQARADLYGMGEVPVVEQSAVDECALLLDAANETRDKIKAYKKTYLAKRDERDSIEVDPTLDELEPRVKILEDDLPRLAEIDRQVADLRDQLAELNKQLNEEDARVRSEHNGKIMLTPSALDAMNASIVAGKMAPEAQLTFTSAKVNDVSNKNAPNGKSDKPEPIVVLPNKLAEQGIPFKEVEDFKIPAKAMRRRRLRLRQYQEEFKQVGETLSGLVDKLEKGLTSHDQKNLTEAIEKTGALVAGMRRRIEIERSIADSTVYRKELERQNKSLTENLSIQGPPFYALSACAFVGGLLFAFALFHRVDLVFGLLGLLAVIGCLVYKTTVERRNRLKLEDNQRRLGLVVKQLEQAQEEAKRLDEKFPAAGKDVNATFEKRLQNAKNDLAFFESLVPVEQQWREATRSSRAQEARLKKAESSLKAAKKRWRSWLHNAFLPTTLSPSQVRDLLARVGVAEDLRRQIDSVTTEVEYLARERQGIVDRFNATLLLVAKYNITETVPALVVPKLRELLGDHSDVLNARSELLTEMNAIKKECRKALALRRRQIREARRFLVGYGVKSKDELVQAVARYDLYLRRVADLEAVQARLDAGIAGFCPEDELGALLADPEIRVDLPTTIENFVKRIESFDAELKGKLELSGRLGQQADAIAAKKGSVRRRFDAIAADLRLAKAAELWQSRAVAGQMMEDIRRAYEKERQPETLREASRYLKRLTNGLYVNIWTPLGEDALFVDASNGETLDVAALSRGTRELLFIAIRLALVVSFEKHGVQMPLIWDDVLVNFDYKRAATAAKLLVDFAKQGRQIFLFTCHEHICQLFLRLGVPVCVLPTQLDPAKRRFRVLKPVKKQTSDLTVDVKRPVEGGPNFVEETENKRSDSFAVDAAADSSLTFVENAPQKNAEPKDERVEYSIADKSADEDEKRAEYAMADGSKHDDLRLRSEPGVARSERPAVVVETDDSAALELKVDERASVDVRVESEKLNYEDEPKSADVCVNEYEGEKLDVDSFVYSTTPADDPQLRCVQTRNVSFDGARAQLRSLSEISPTFSSDPKVEESNLRVVEPKPASKEPVGPYADDGVEYLEIDASKEFDDGWNEFLSGVKSKDSDSDKSFNDFLVDADVEKAYESTDEEYLEESDDEEDADEEYEDDEYEDEEYEEDEYEDDEEEDDEEDDEDSEEDEEDVD